MIQYTIYDHPGDYPKHFVVRRWVIVPGGYQVDDEVRLFDTLEAAREAIDPDLICLTRAASDEPQIVETWL
jgi:hypothetical protein